tara:strand:- start:3027 stop:4001 length:975 start_codon:yes stop_codon:yes gene_type:complete
MSETESVDTVAQDNAPQDNEGLTLEALERLAHAADTGATEELESKPEPETGSPSENQAPDGETGGENESSVGAEDGSLTTETETPAKSRSEKDAARLDKGWKTLNGRKEAFDAEREAFEKERAALERELEELRRLKASNTDDYRDAHGYTAEDYEKHSRAFKAEGEYEKSEWAEGEADRVREDAKRKAKEVETQVFQEKWSTNFEKMAEKHTELNDRTSDLSKRVLKLMQDKPFLTAYPEGIVDAVDVALMQLQRGEGEELKGKLEKAETELEEYKKKLSIGGSPPADRPSDTSFDGMKEEDQMRHLEKLAAEYDRGGSAMLGG